MATVCSECGQKYSKSAVKGSVFPPGAAERCPNCRRALFINSLLGSLRDERVPLDRLVPLQFEEFKWDRPRGEGWAKTVCFACNQGCDALVRTNQGQPVEIKGDPWSLADPDLLIGTGGKLCPKGLSELDRFYHPERLSYPMRRVGSRGSGQWERISWDQALDEISGRMKELSAAYGKESIVFCTGTSRGWMEFFDRFVNAFGSFRIGPGVAQCYRPRYSGQKLTFGGDAMECPDFSKTRTILVWGTNPAATWPKKARGLMKAWARGARLIVVDPQLSAVASKADLWLSLRPGTDAALALAMIHTIIVEDLWDKEFVANWCFGFDELRAHVQDYPPEKAAAITGVPADQIRAAARLYATGRPSTLLECVATEQNKDTLSCNRAMAILIAITGNLDVPGGNVFSVHFGADFTSPELKMTHLLGDEQHNKRIGNKEYPLLSGKEALKYNPFSPTGHSALVWDAILYGRPYKVRMMYNHGSNMLRSFANTHRVRQALLNLEYFVCADLFMTETTQLADIVLPAGTWMERSYVHDNSQASYNSVQLQQKLATFAEAWSDFKILNELAKRLGLGQYFFDKEEDIAEWRTRLLGMTWAELKEKGGLLSKPMEYRKYEKAGFKTASGKVEIYSRAMEELGLSPLPAYLEPTESPVSSPELYREYPYILTTGARPSIFRHTEYRNVKRLSTKMPHPPAYIHPDTARQAGVADQDEITLSNHRGKTRAVARVTLGIAPGVVQVPHGWGGDWNVNYLTNDQDCAPGIGSAQLRGLLCNITKGWEL